MSAIMDRLGKKNKSDKRFTQKEDEDERDDR